MPVWSGSFTGWRSTTPGALNSMRPGLRALDRRSAVERDAERIDDPADHRVADRDRHDLPGAADGVALLDLVPLAEQHRGDVVLLEVQREAGDAVVELEPLERDAAVEAVDAGDAVADLDDGADLLDVGLHVIALDLGLQDVGDLVWSQLHASLPTGKGVRTSARRISSSRRRTDASRRTPRALRTRPPMIAGSTVATTLASWPTAAESRSRRFSTWRVVEGHGGGHVDRQDAILGGDELGIGGGGVGDQRQPAVVGEHERGVPDERLGALEQLPHHALLGVARDRGVGKRRAGAAGSRPAPSSSAFRSASTSRVRPASRAAAYSASA